MTKKITLAPPPPAALDPLEFLLRVARGEEHPAALRVEAAIAILPYLYEAKTPLRCPHCGEYVTDSLGDEDE